MKKPTEEKPTETIITWPLHASATTPPAVSVKNEPINNNVRLQNMIACSGAHWRGLQSQSLR